MARSIPDEQILQAALDVIAANGYAGSTTRQIAAAANMNEVTLFRRFGNKQKLLMAVVEQEATQFGNDEVDYTGNLEADLKKIVLFYQRLLSERGQVMMMLISEVPRHPELLDIMNHATANAMRFATIIQQYQTAGKLTDQPPMRTFIELLGPLFLASILKNTNPQIPELDIDTHVRNFLRGHATTKIQTFDE